jgi:hypothetical protein
MQRETCIRAALAKSLAVAAFSATLLAANEAASQQPFLYVAKFVCGRAVTTPGTPPPVATGFYFTAINVHTMVTTEFKKRMSVALPGEKAGKVSQTFPAALKENEAMEIDCPDIMKHLEAREPFAKGFVTLESPRELDVVAVYTVAAAPTGNVIALEVERVPKR